MGCEIVECISAAGFAFVFWRFAVWGSFASKTYMPFFYYNFRVIISRKGRERKNKSNETIKFVKLEFSIAFIVYYIFIHLSESSIWIVIVIVLDYNNTVCILT